MNSTVTGSDLSRPSLASVCKRCGLGIDGVVNRYRLALQVEGIYEAKDMESRDFSGDCNRIFGGLLSLKEHVPNGVQNG